MPALFSCVHSLALTGRRGSGPDRALISSSEMLPNLGSLPALTQAGGGRAASPAGTGTLSTEERTWQKASCAGLKLRLLPCRPELHPASCRRAVEPNSAGPTDEASAAGAAPVAAAA